MKTHTPLPLPLEIQIARHSKNMEWFALIFGFCVGFAVASVSWCWITWGFHQ